MRGLIGLALLVYGLGINAQVAVPGRGSVAGKVFCADSNTPCRYATITLIPVPSGRQIPSKASSPQYSSISNMDGTYLINDVPAGSYDISGYITGYVSSNVTSDSTANYDVANQVSPESRIVVSDDQVTSTTLLLRRGGALSGNVHYDGGAPAINIPIHIYKKNSRGSWELYKPSPTTGALAALADISVTDDQGHFRQAGLPDGSYTVEASLPDRRALTEGLIDINASTNKTLQVFEGNGNSLNTAQAVDIRLGDEASGVDITLPTESLFTIQGAVQDQATGGEVSSGKVILLDGTSQTEMRYTEIGPDGSFAFDHVNTGSYILRIEAKSNDTLASRYGLVNAPLVVEGNMTDLTLQVVRLNNKAISP